jgi:hypothetical protein
MKMAIWITACALCACESSKQPPAVAEPVAPLSPFKADRARACEAFADRVTPGLKNHLPMDQTLAGNCMTQGRVTAANYACLLASKSGDELSACFATQAPLPSAEFQSNKNAACLAYARHVIALMSDDLRRTMREICLSPKMKESDFDCVMAAKTDDAVRRCLSSAP